MKPSRGRTLAAVAALFASLACAQAASAAVYDVSDSAELQQALTDAGASPLEADTINLAPGTYLDADGWEYPFGGGPLTLDGAGSDVTHLEFTSGGPGFLIGETDVTVQDVSMAVPDGLTGFGLTAADDTLRHVEVTGADGGTGVQIGADATLDDVTIAFDPAEVSTGVAKAGPGTPAADLTAVSITAQTGIDAAPDSTWTIGRSRISGRDGIAATNADVGIVNSLIEKTTSGGTPISFSAGPTGDHSLSGTYDTIVDRSNEASDFAISATTSGLSHASVSFEATLFGGFGDELTGSGPAGSLQQSFVNDELFTTLAATPVANAGTGDYRPRADSVLIDRIHNGAGGPLDLAGNPRDTDFRGPAGVDGDIGAFELQPHAPTLTALNPDPPSGTNVTFHPNDADQDPGDQLTYLWSFDGGASTVGVRNQPHDFGTTGSHTASLTVVDLSGRTASASATITIPSPPPHSPTVSLAASNTSPASGEAVTFTATASDLDGDSLDYLWSFDGGPSASGNSMEIRSFSSPGPHTASVTVIDPTARTASSSVTVTVPAPSPHSPTVSVAASNTSPASGETVTFTTGASDPDGDSLDYLWSFDGGPSSAGNPTEMRSFTSPGPHTASVTVIDSTARTASDSVTVTVPAPPPQTQTPAQQTPAQTQTPVVTPASNLRAGTCINAFNGTPAADKLTGSQFGDAIVGGGGNDVLAGLAGNDCLIGDEGNDSLDGGEGDDDVRGLAGNDKVRGGAGNDNLLGGAGKDGLDGAAGADVLTGGSGVDRFSSGAGNDEIDAADGKRERVSCGSGRDTVTADRIDRIIGCEKKHLRGKKR